ncbi:polymorphic toxin-type HINT domain-containing protein [Kitasatospora sp. NPDC059160]|uniref:polymorphic toxin-type HINT domain-containing protein n=1 Tax=Kitasatospora sp. NPDC059160 TaxID=3346748 RepID=UPI0036784ACA
MYHSISRSRRGGRRDRPLLGRLFLSLLPIAMVTGLLGTGLPDAVAAEQVGEQVQLSDRERVLRAWLKGGPSVHTLAEVALAGDDRDVKRFLENDLAGAEHADDLLAATQIASLGGPKVRDAAGKAIDGSAAELKTFLQSGWQQALAADQRLWTTRIIDPATGTGRGLQAAGDAALRGSTDDVQQFLTEGQFKAKDTDDRVKLVQVLSAGGANTQAAARVALNGTIEDVREFLKVGQYIAQSRDQERASIAQLAQQAKDAGAQAAQETSAAIEAKDKAVYNSQRAKEDAARAVAETQAAGSDTAKATAAANNAATAAERAGDAAKTAITAARAANASARATAYAASNAAAAAAGAQRAAARARTAASAAAGDASKAHEARVAADEADAAAKLAVDAKATLVEVKRAASNSKDAAGAATSARGNADAAAGSASQAGAYADSAGGQSAKAKRAAEATRRQAAEAGRAATASQKLAGEAAGQAEAAMTLLTSAATHASAAAQAARDAADRAGQSSNAAQESTDHANAASGFATDAQAAVDKAGDVQELARRTEAEDLTNRTATAVETARKASADEADKQAETDKARQEVKKARTEADRLAQAVSQPGTTPQQVATDGRKLALLSRKISGTWGSEAAEAALTGPDTAVFSYLKTGRRAGEEHDARERATQIYTDSENQAVRAAAYTALQGDTATIEAFLSAGQYEAAAPNNRLTITRLIDKAGPAVRAAGDAALRTNTPAALRDFLDKGLADAQAADDRLTTTRLADAPTTQPELKAAARTALEAPVLQLRAFVAEEQYTAQRKDQLTAVHVADVTALIAQATAAAATAQKNAAEAQRVAAIARGAANEAAGFANTAQRSANTAADHVTKAQTAVEAAQTSATNAAQSAKSANTAQASAKRDAASAVNSSRRAAQSASLAKWAAANAYESAREARASAMAAGKDARAAQDAADDAHANYEDKLAAEEKARLAKLEEDRQKAEELRKLHDKTQQAADELAAKQKQDQVAAIEEEIKKQKEDNDSLNALYHIFSESVHLTLDIIGGAGGMIAPGLADIADLINCAYYAVEGRTAEAITSCIGAIPFIGDGVAVAKFGQWAKKFGNYGDKAAEFIKKLVTRVPTSCPTIPNSFPAGTRVLMGDGSSKSIEEVRLGDKVLATDPVTGDTSPETVERLIHSPDDRDFTDLTIAGETKSGSLTATDRHPFWAENKHDWVEAADLAAGDRLRTPTGSTATVSEVRHRTDLQAAYNLTVEELHTYYVLADETPVLVHNDNCFDPLVQAAKSKLPERKDGQWTTGFARGDGGNRNGYNLQSGIDNVDDKRFADWVNAKLKEGGVPLGNATSVRATDVEQKFVARMYEENITMAELAINHKGGPCDDALLGCDAVLDYLLGDKDLLVHWPDPKCPDGWRSRAYGKNKATWKQTCQ